ncbi:type I restriction-modification system subunit M [Sphingobacterium lactis]|uniref:type I restriction-modification system subunit M n=1 Tax=Sphingobacterium lactis TaxID=797291 RepID=UPI003F7F47F3
MNKQQLAAKIWESANQMRSKIEANEYKDYILGFIFYKYLCESEIKFVKKEGDTDEDIKNLSEEDTEAMEHIRSNIGYFISYNNLFSTWIKEGYDFSVADVRDALSAFSRLISPAHKRLFDGIFDTLQTGLSKLGDSAAAQTKAIRELLQLIKDIPMDGKQDYDVLGFIYEYLIEKFASNAGKKAGEFYTPHEVSLLMSDIIANHLRDKETIEIYDPTSGSGSLLINIGKSLTRHIDGKDNIKYFAQELKQNTYNLTRMNLIMRGLKPNNIVTRNGDTLEEDWPYFEESDPINSYSPLYVDAVVSNPPYSQKWDPTDKDADARYARFGLAPKSKADFAFLLHDLYHLKPDGIMAIVLPHGVLFRGGEEGTIRKNLIEQNHIDAIIGLPANIFFGTGIPTVILILKQKRTASDILVIDASKGFVKDAKNNKLRASDIKRITDTVINRQNVPQFAKVVSREEIRDNEYNLNIPRYVDSSEPAEQWDIYATMFGGIPTTEINTLEEFWKELPTLQNELFEQVSSEIASLKSSDVKGTVKANTDVQAFIRKFQESFRDFDMFLKKRLIDNVQQVKLVREIASLSIEIFKRMEHLPLVDRYQAYQLLEDKWEEISGDIEMLQTEGLAAAKQVDANIVVKKIKSKDTEVQDGWKGHVFPFELVQQVLLQDELAALTDKQNRIASIGSELEVILEGISEEAKESSIVNEAKDAFVSAELVKYLKEVNAEIKRGIIYAEDSDEAQVLKANKLLADDKVLKKELKKATDDLHTLTKNTIESLSDEQVVSLLKQKWIRPLVVGIQDLPTQVLQQLIQKVEHLASKYSTTLKDVATSIKQTEKSLSDLMNELTGSDYDMQGIQALQQLLRAE